MYNSLSPSVCNSTNSTILVSISSHAFLIGGGVNGGKVEGDYPHPLNSLHSQWVGGRRVIPTTPWEFGRNQILTLCYQIVVVSANVTISLTEVCSWTVLVIARSLMAHAVANVILSLLLSNREPNVVTKCFAQHCPDVSSEFRSFIDTFG